MASPSDMSSLLTRIRTVGQAELHRLKVIGLSVLVILLFGAFLCFSASDIAFKLDKGTRLAAGIASLAGLTIALVKFVSLYASRKDARDKIAAEVETKWPELEASLTTSVEFGSDPKKAELLSSPEIVAKLIEQTEERSRVMDFLRVVNWRLAAGLGVVAGILMLACLAYVAFLPRLASLTFHRFVKPWANIPPPTLTVVDVQPKNQDIRKFANVEVVARIEGRIPRDAAIQFSFVKPPGQPGSPEWQRQIMEKKDNLLYTFRFPRLQDSVKFRVKAGDCTTDEYLLDVYEPPKIVKVTATFRYPEYTGLQAKTEDDFLGPISAIKGTVVELTAVTNVPVTRAALALRRERALFANAELVEPTKLKTAIEVHQNLKYALFVQDAKGRVNNDAPFHAVKVIPDKAPEIKVAKPPKNTKGTKTSEIPMSLEASDDFGVSEVGIAYKVKTDDEQRLTLREFRERMAKVQAQDTFYLEQMGLDDTDIVTYYAYARDNDEVSGPKEGVSDLHFVEIRPYGEQYKKAPGKPEEQGEGKQGELMPKLDDIIKQQRAVLGETFTMDKTATGPRTEEQATKITDLGAQEEGLRKKTDALSKRLMSNLEAAGLSQHLDRVEHLVRGANDMALASNVLSNQRTREALPPENNALYHLYRAKRDLLHLIEEAQKNPKDNEKLEQALEMAAKQSQDSERREADKETADLEKQAKELAKILEEQRKLNADMREMAAESLRTEKGTPTQSPQQQAKAQQEAAQKQGELSDRAKNQATKLRKMAQQNPQVSNVPQREMERATMEMQEARRDLQADRNPDARDHGKKAEDRVAAALRELERAMERTAAEELKSLAQRARELAERQREVGTDTDKAAQQMARQQPNAQEQQQADARQAKASPQQQAQQQALSQAQAQQQVQQPQTPSQSTPRQAQATAQQQAQAQQQSQQQASAQAQAQSEAQRQAQAKAGQPSRQEQDQQADQRADAQQKPQAGEPRREPEGHQAEQKPTAQLAESQREVRSDFDRLGKDIAKAENAVAKTDKEAAKELAKAGQKAREGPTKDQMAKAEEQLRQAAPTEARKDQKAAEQGLKQLATELRDIADKFGMDDAERLAKAADKARDLAQRQETLNKDMAKGSAQDKEKEKPAQRSSGNPEQKQRELQEETKNLAKDVERIKPLEEAGLDKRVKENLDRASDAMQQARQEMARRNAKSSEAKGKEAATELRQSESAMRQVLQETLNQQLAKAVEAAKEAKDAQTDAKAALQKAAQGKRDGQPMREEQAEETAQKQAEAQARTQDLSKAMAKASAQASASGSPQVAKSVQDTAKELKDAKAEQNQVQAQKDMQNNQWQSAQRNQQAANQALASAHQALQDLYEDVASLPLQRLKQAEKATRELASAVDQLKQKAEQPQRGRDEKPKDSDKPEDAKALAEQQKELQKQASALTNRLERLNPTPEERERLKEMNAKMAEAASKLAKGQRKEATTGLNETSKALQSIGEGLIKKIARLVDKANRRAAVEEDAPEEYRQAIERYYQALSEK